MLEYDRSIKEVFTMSFRLNHLHIKSSDPSKTAEWYVDTFRCENSVRGWRVAGLSARPAWHAP